MITRLLTLFIITSLHAQEQKTTSLRFTTIQELSSPDLHLIFATKTSPITISSRNLSLPVTLPTGTPIYLCSAIPTEFNPQEISKVSLTKFTLKPTAKEFIALLTPTQNNKLKTTLIKSNKFPWGSRLVFNLSSKPISISCANSKLNLKSKTSGILKPTNAKNGDFIPVIGLYGDQKKTRRFLSSRWIQDSKSRSIIFIYDKNKKKAPTFHGVEDTKIPTPEDAP